MCVFFFLIFFIKTYIVGTHLNCIDAIQMGTHNICLYKEVDKKKYIGCKLKSTEFLACALTGACAVIRWNMVFLHKHIVSTRRNDHCKAILISTKTYSCARI